MRLVANCRFCRQDFTIAAEAAGRTIACPHCGEGVYVPAPPMTASPMSGALARSPSSWSPLASLAAPRSDRPTTQRRGSLDDQLLRAALFAPMILSLFLGYGLASYLTTPVGPPPMFAGGPPPGYRQTLPPGYPPGFPPGLGPEAVEGSGGLPPWRSGRRPRTETEPVRFGPATNVPPPGSPSTTDPPAATPAATESPATTPAATELPAVAPPTTNPNTPPPSPVRIEFPQNTRPIFALNGAPYAAAFDTGSGTSLMVYDLRTGRPFLNWAPMSQSIDHPAINSEGKQLAFAAQTDQGYFLHHWRWGEGEPTKFPLLDRKFGTDSTPIFLGFGNDKLVYVPAAAGWVQIWDVSAKLKPRVQIADHWPTSGRAYAISPNGERLVAYAKSHELVVLDVANERIVTRLREQSREDCQALAFSLDGRFLLGQFPSSLLAWDFATGMRLTPQRVPYAGGGPGTFAPSDSFSLDGSVALQPLPNGRGWRVGAGDFFGLDGNFSREPAGPAADVHLVLGRYRWALEPASRRSTRSMTCDRVPMFPE